MGSALSDPYLSFSAAMNGLAGPLHGLANQVSTVFRRVKVLGGGGHGCANDGGSGVSVWSFLLRQDFSGRVRSFESG